MPKTLPLIDVTAPVCCAPLASGVMDAGDALGVALRLKALADPVRVQLLSMLLSAPQTGVCTSDLAPALGITEATTSFHLARLREAGLCHGTRQGTYVYYRANPDALCALVKVLRPDCC